MGEGERERRCGHVFAHVISSRIGLISGTIGLRRATPKQIKTIVEEGRGEQVELGIRAVS
eukprot:756862-Hanusia_phi.AAC.2